MTLKNIISGIVHHARRTRAHCPTMVSSFKLSSRTVRLSKFCPFCKFSNASGRGPQIFTKI